MLRSSGTGEIRRGWIQVRTGTASVSGLLTYKQGTTGIEVSVEPAELGDRFALFVEESGDVGAGVAVFKPEEASSHPAPSPRRSGERPFGGGVRLPGKLSPIWRSRFRNGSTRKGSTGDF